MEENVKAFLRQLYSVFFFFLKYAIIQEYPIGLFSLFIIVDCVFHREKKNLNYSALTNQKINAQQFRNLKMGQGQKYT